MARLWAHEAHEYTHFDDKGVRTFFVFPRQTWREVPDEVASRMVREHPSKFAILGAGEERPPAPVEQPAPYETAAISEAAADRMARPRTRRK